MAELDGEGEVAELFLEDAAVPPPLLRQAPGPPAEASTHGYIPSQRKLRPHMQNKQIQPPHLGGDSLAPKAYTVILEEQDLRATPEGLEVWFEGLRDTYVFICFFDSLESGIAKRVCFQLKYNAMNANECSNKCQ